jgi:hypothetical protein
MSTQRFSKNTDFDFEIRCALGQAPCGGADIGEVLAAVAGIKPKDSEGWFDAWSELSLATQHSAEDAEGRKLSDRRRRLLARRELLGRRRECGLGAC